MDPTTRKVFVADGFRVLRFANADALANGKEAEVVFGQGNFTTATAPSTPNEFRFSALGITVDRNGRLWVADINNKRVLRFDNASNSGNFPAATRVYGQQNFTTNATGFDAKGMAGPTDVVVDLNDRLWVADASNNRVLRFDNISSKPSGASADAVLGQATLSTVGGGPEGLSQSTMDIPYSLAISATGTLFVADRDNNRILRFTNAAGLPNGANASAVLGQAQFNTETTDVIASKMNVPSGISISADDTLWVADRYNHRVLRFNGASTKGNGASADGVLGQPDFFSNQQNNNTQGAFSQNSQGFLFPEYLFVDDAKGGVWVSDSQNKRVLRFGGVSVPPKDTTKPNVTVAKFPKTTRLSNLKIKGSASDNRSVKRVQYRIGKGAPKTANGTTRWSFNAKLKKGENKITIYATDTTGNVSLSKIIKINRK
jgi:sugar lactone lactonase YvrE